MTEVEINSLKFTILPVVSQQLYLFKEQVCCLKCIYVSSLLLPLTGRGEGNFNVYENLHCR